MAETKTGIATRPVFSAAFLLDFFRSLTLSKSKVIPSIILFGTYVITGAASIYINREFNVAPALIWAPAGVALAGMVLAGYAMIPAIFLASVATSFFNGYELPVLIGSALGNTLQPVLGMYLLQRFKFNPILSQAKDIYALLIVVVLAALVLPSITLVTSWLFGVIPLQGFSASWGRIWVGDMLSLLILTPFITCWVLKPRIESKPLEIIERGAAFLLFLVISYELFWTLMGQIAGVPLPYILLIPLLWIGLRFTPRWMTLALACMTIGGLSGIVWLAHIHAISNALGSRLFGIELFILVIGAMFLVFSSIVQERRSATKALEVHVERLQKAVARIQLEDDAKSEFLAILAHEMRNPLALILSTLEFLKLRIPAEIEEGSMLRGAEDRVHTMSRMLDDLLDMSRISQRTFELQKQPVELQTSMGAALQSVALVMQNRDHHFSISLPETPIWLMVDPVRFEQIVINLLTNAAKYTPEGGEIALAGTLEGGEFVLRVRDNGIGIPSHLLDRIFEPFQQVSEKRLRTAGLGIGLSITKRLVEMHGGTIEAHSRGAGQGSDFIVRFPLLAVQAAAPAHKAPVQREPAVVLSAFDILIVDDNEAAAQGMGKLLQHKGHTVHFAYSGKEAIKEITERAPAVTILDIGLPDIDGYEVAQYVRKEAHTSTVLIALTGYGQEEDKQKARDAGFDFHLTKPVNVTDIEAILAVVKAV